jgi:subtilisin family serine protease
MSFGGRGETGGERRALRYAIKRDVVLIAAAADQPIVNQGRPAGDLQPPGTAPRIAEGKGLVVTAADSSDQRAFFAGRGSQISLAAYGTGSASVGPPGIFSTYPQNETQFDTGATRPPSKPCGCRINFRGDTRFAYQSGTSMAAPQVAGIVALVRTANPRLPNVSVIQLMKESARQTSWNAELGWGIVDAGAAVSRAIAYAPDTVAPSTSPRGSRKRVSGRSFRLRWKSKDGAPPGVTASGVASFRVLVKRGRRNKLVAETGASSYRFEASRGRSYAFMIQARDRAGNLEPLGQADVLVRVRG